MLSNATRITPTFVDVMEDVGVCQVNVSIYGATASIYERMTDVPGSFAHFLRGLSFLTGRPFPVTVRMPVTTINVYEVSACRQMVEELGFKFQYCLDIHPRVDGLLDPLQYRLSPSRKAQLNEQMLGARSALMA
jgi:MoaA/NifB/PqqE/SkfB family radical SAM enzyme